MIDSEEFNLSLVLETENYRQFIQIWLQEKNKTKKWGYADIARVGGFSARSFPRDVVGGSKRLTLKSLPKMSRGLLLPAALKSYFQLLVELEHEDCRTSHATSELILRNITKHRDRLLKKDVHSPKADDAFSIANIPEVYASLGGPEFGSRLDDIISRTQLPESVIMAALEKMLHLQMIQKKKYRYYPTQQHISLEGLKKSQLFKHHFRKCCEKASDVARKNFESDEHLFLSSAFSVNRKDLPKLKEDLRSLLLSYIDTTEKAEGNSVVNLVAGLF